LAVTLDTALGTKAQSASTTAVLTTTAAVASGGHILLVAGHFFAGATTRACAGGSLTWTEDAYLKSGSLHISIFRASAPSGLASSTNITVTWGNAGDSLVGAGSFLGIDTSGTVIASGTNNGSLAGWGTGSIASTSGNMLFGGAFMDGAVTTSTPTSPASELFDVNSAGQTETATGAYKLSVSGSDSIDGTWASAAGWAAAGVCYKATAGAATVVRSRLLAGGVG
jgi:hypothetical protein